MTKVKFEVLVNADIDEEDIIKYVRKHFWPAHIFSESELRSWAESNGYVKEK